MKVHYTYYYTIIPTIIPTKWKFIHSFLHFVACANDTFGGDFNVNLTTLWQSHIDISSSKMTFTCTPTYKQTLQVCTLKDAMLKFKQLSNLFFFFIIIQIYFLFILAPICTCASGYQQTGPSAPCDLICADLFCENGGYCNADYPYCQCLPGFYGDNCESSKCYEIKRIIHIIITYFLIGRLYAYNT